MKYRALNFILSLAFMAVSACVTVNVYFPESAAQRAADIFIRDVYGEDANADGPDAPAPDQPQSMYPVLPSVQIALTWLGDFLISPAQAQAPDINIQTPAINRLKGAMASRHQKLKPGYASGAIGMATTGLLVLRDAKAIPLKQRNQTKQLVVQENNDRNRLYKEIATANGHAEWEKEIRAIFARRWVGNAPSGWWYESAGNWQQK